MKMENKSQIIVAQGWREDATIETLLGRLSPLFYRPAHMIFWDE